MDTPSRYAMDTPSRSNMIDGETPSRRKRRWDQNQQGEESYKPLVIDQDKAIATAIETANKINASIGITTTNPLEATSNATSSSSNPSSSLSSSSDRKFINTTAIIYNGQKTLSQSFGLDKEDPIKKPISKNLLKKVNIKQTVDINDTRHRYFLTKSQTQSDLEKEYGVTILVRGKYFPDRRLATEREPALCMDIMGDYANKVEECIQKIKEIIINGPAGCTQLGKIETSIKIPVNIDLSVHYHLRNKIMGPQGSFLRHIQQQSGCKVQLGGRGGFSKGSNVGNNGIMINSSPSSSSLVNSSLYSSSALSLEEQAEPSHILISGYKLENIEKARRLSEDLLNTIRKDATEYLFNYYNNPMMTNSMVNQKDAKTNEQSNDDQNVKIDNETDNQNIKIGKIDNETDNQNIKIGKIDNQINNDNLETNIEIKEKGSITVTTTSSFSTMTNLDNDDNIENEK